LPCAFADITDRGYRGLVTPVRILGGILAAGGGVALVTAMTAMERIGDCGSGYDPPCPPGIENDFVLMAGAVMAIAVGSIMTWGVGLAVAVVAAGVAALVYSQTVPTDLRIGEFVTAAVCFGLLAVAIAIGWDAHSRDHVGLTTPFLSDESTRCRFSEPAVRRVLCRHRRTVRCR
jgi:hypothetical protein